MRMRLLIPKNEHCFTECEIVNAVRDGECLGDSMWPSLRCRKDQNVGDIHAKIMGHFVDYCLLFGAHLCFCSSHSRAHWRDYPDF